MTDEDIDAVQQLAIWYFTNPNSEYQVGDSFIFYIKNEDGTFERFEEQHYQHGFTEDEVREAVKKAGLKIRNVYDAFTHNPPDAASERLYYILEK